jgi:sugar O-acyltransferase (sialic acid O-acetyltransferase NeuD family)
LRSGSGQVVILGAGGFGREVLWLIREIGTSSTDRGWRVAGFIDDDPAKIGLSVCGVPVLGKTKALGEKLRHLFSCVCGHGEPVVKRRLVAAVRDHVTGFPVLAHPSVRRSEYVAVGAGCILTANCLLTTQITLGEFVTVNLGCTIGHDVEIGDYTTLAPGVHVSGNVHLGELVNLGTGAVVLPGVSIGPGTTVGAGAVVTRDLPGGVVAVGVPARVVGECRERRADQEK